MLTLNLVRVREISDQIVPYYIDVQDPKLLEIAEVLLRIYQQQQNQTRKSLDESLEELLECGKHVHLCRGLNRLLEDRCSFFVDSHVEPSEARKTVFEFASLARSNGQFDRQQILQQAASSWNTNSQELETILFADLKQNQIMKDFKNISAANLLKRYNTALAQAILLKSNWLKIQIREREKLRYRQLFRAIKFYRLLYQITGDMDQGFAITLDGPMSLFQNCQKYGLQMALFLPALLLCKNWHLQAELRWGTRKCCRYFVLDADKGLYSHYPDTGMYIPPELRTFAERFRKLQSEWQISDDCDIVEITQQQMCIPDYVFRHSNGKVVYLEIFGFWRKAALEKRLAELETSHVPLLLAVSKTLHVENTKCKLLHRHLYFFRQVLNPKEIIKYLQHY